jgi:phosphatidylserine/phosphatidylglycerophosphate/cardiolipin synthase-like enzyme
MNKQSQWLFETPVVSETTLSKNPYSNHEWQPEWEFPEVFPLNEQEWETVGRLKVPRRSVPKRPGRVPHFKRFSCPPVQSTQPRIVYGWGQYKQRVQELPPDQQAILRKVGNEIRMSYQPGCQPVRMVQIYGHADRDPKPEREQQISDERARIVTSWLKNYTGTSIATQIKWEIRGMGASQLKAAPTNEVNRRQNRRVEILMMTAKTPPPPIVPPVPPKPVSPTLIPNRWLNLLGPQGVRTGNQVASLIGGGETFKAMVEAIRTATGPGHYIYLLAWWLTDDFQLILGDPNSKISQLFTDASNKGVQIRVMLWDQVGEQNNKEADKINALARGGAIVDNFTLNFGSHHQKVLVVKGQQGLISFCGGIDINPDRIFDRDGLAKIGKPASSSGVKGQPLHDVHCRIQGLVAHDLLRLFIQRWDAHPKHKEIDTKKGTLIGRSEIIPSFTKAPIIQSPRLQNNLSGISNNCFVKIGVTTNQVNSSNIFVHKVVRRERSLQEMMISAIQGAQRFIYMENQYLVNIYAAQLLREALKKIQHLTILIPHPSISDLPQVWERTKAFINVLTEKNPNAYKVRIFCLANRGIYNSANTYIHAKTYVIDDELAIIGSANCNRRGWTHDSEVIAAIFDQSLPNPPAKSFAQQLRMRLWGKHLSLSPGLLEDGIKSADHWLAPPTNARISIFDPDSGKDGFPQPKWDTIVDPQGPE